MNPNENDQNSFNDFQFMFILEGLYNSGKSSLLSRYAHNDFPIFDNFATIGSDFKQKNLIVDNYTVKLTIWDTQGSEKISELMRKRLYSKIGCIFILVDLSKSIESFYFYEEIFIKAAELANNPVIVLVGSKFDLPRKVESEILAEWAKEKGVFYIETSAKTGYNVNEAIYLGTSELIKKINLSEYTYITKNQIVLKSQEFKWYRENTCL